ncbi:hypothetical protein BGZ81_001492 [Podila clonocystis]|nr:hypothetical protein BGZ81_001492 [Podila clonocystis]
MEASFPLSERFPESTLSLGTLTRLVVCSSDEQDLCDLMAYNPGLQQLEVYAQERELFHRLSTVCHSYAAASRRMEITLMEQGLIRTDEFGVIAPIQSCARVVVGLPMNGPSAIARLLNRITQEDVYNATVIEVLYWNVDYVSGELCDQDAAILDLATQKFPWTITSIVVDLSLLGLQGLLSLSHVCQRSSLERLHIMCHPLSYPEDEVKLAIIKILDAVHWPTVQFLRLSGSDIDGWIQLLSKAGALFNAGSLLSLVIIGIGPTQLSHTSFLALHNMLFPCELIELRIENVTPQDASDWDVIIEALASSPLEVAFSAKGVIVPSLA